MSGRPDQPKAPRGGLGAFLASPRGIALCLLVAAAGFYLWVDHRLHVLAALPFLAPAILCLGMHLLMHGRHGGQR